MKTSKQRIVIGTRSFLLAWILLFLTVYLFCYNCGVLRERIKNVVQFGDQQKLEALS